MSNEENRKVLEEFLSYPIHTAEDIFLRFEALPGAVAGKSGNPLERYVCIPGTRKDRIVLVAHADTVWDMEYGNPTRTSVRFEDGCYKSTKPTCGIGADDRAGCAMLWLLRESGHTILLVNGEEKGKWGAKFLRGSNPQLFQMLNEHRFMLELDTWGTARCNYNQVDNTKKFRNYIGKTMGFRDDTQKGGCDLQILCEKICGVNVSVGYHNHHTPEEYLSLAEWEHTLSSLKTFLEQEHPRFCTSCLKRFSRFLGRIKRKLCGNKK